MIKHIAEQTIPAVRCAIYTRKSTDENLDSDFNSLDAQRESAENYIKSQSHERWIAVTDRYDDGAYSGATLERPALQKLLRDVDAGKIDVVVVYKIDRLSRSLLDFAKLIETFESKHVTMVSVTQQFNTTTSMGRLTLNVLLSFAQFEREVIAERIRDKVAGAKRRGKWMGGTPPLGYDVDRANKRLIVNDEEANLVRYIFRRFLQLGSATALVKELDDRKERTKSWTTVKGKTKLGNKWNKNSLYKLLNNRVYVGEVSHKGNVYKGEQEAIIEKSLWDEVRATMKSVGAKGKPSGSSFLSNLLFCGDCGHAMGSAYTKKNGRRYRYYVCQRARKSGYDECKVKSFPAGEIEGAVMGEVRKALNQPEVIEQTLNKINRIEEEEKKRLEGERVGEEEEIGKLKSAASRLLNADGVFAKEELARLECELAVRMNRLGQIDAELDSLNNAANSRDALTTELANLAPLWDELFPAEKRRIMALLFDRIDAYEDRLRITQAGNHNTFDIPMKIKRIGGRKKIIVPGDAQRESLPEDRRMAIAAALGHRWMGLLLDGRFNSVGELAEEIGIDPSLIRRHLGWTCVQARDIESMLGEG